jgi:hypothetical protein
MFNGAVWRFHVPYVRRIKQFAPSSSQLQAKGANTLNLRDKTSRTSATLILNASLDPVLLNNRAKLLNEAGYYTTAAHSLEEAMRTAVSMNCDLALLCYSFDSTQRTAISERLQRLSPGTAIVWLQPGMDDNQCVFVARVKDALNRMIA